MSRASLTKALSVALFVVAATLAAPSATPAADLGAAPQPQSRGVLADANAAIRDYISRRAALLMLRSTFDVIAPEDVGTLLRQDLEQLGGNAPSQWDNAALATDLLTEASYYLVSLSYLIEAGGALWPADRAESLYVNDALMQLDALKGRLVETVDAGADPLPLLEELQRIHWWTEGETEVPEGEDRFAGRDSLVTELLATHGPSTST